MTATSFVRNALLAGALALAVPAFAAEPTIKEVYAAAEAGKYADAQAMMDQVLKAHPNSANAHFVEAELLAKQGQFSAAQAELAKAESLAPGLPKVNPSAVAKLRTLLAEGQKPRASYAQQPARSGNSGYSNSNYGNAGGSGTPWGTIIILGIVLVGFIVVVSRFMSRRQQQQVDTYNPGYTPGGGAAPGYAPGAYPQQGYPQPGYGQPQGSGMGSRIMGGLATGAAVGAGIVAGEALARQFTGGNHDSGSHDQPRNDIVYDDPSQNDLLRRDDMGGNDFGVSGGWDDSGGGGGDSGGGGGDWD